MENFAEEAHFNLKSWFRCTLPVFETTEKLYSHYYFTTFHQITLPNIINWRKLELYPFLSSFSPSFTKILRDQAILLSNSIFVTPTETFILFCPYFCHQHFSFTSRWFFVFRAIFLDKHRVRLHATFSSAKMHCTTSSIWVFTKLAKRKSVDVYRMVWTHTPQ